MALQIPGVGYTTQLPNPPRVGGGLGDAVPYNPLLSGFTNTPAAPPTATPIPNAQPARATTVRRAVPVSPAGGGIQHAGQIGRTIARNVQNQQTAWRGTGRTDPSSAGDFRANMQTLIRRAQARGNGTVSRPNGTTVNLPGATTTATPPTGAPALAPGIAPVQTTINGNDTIFSEPQTNQYANTLAGSLLEQGDPRQAMQAFTRPGLSRDAGTYAAALPQISGARSMARRALAEVPLQDYLANELFGLSGQEAQANEALQLAELLRRLQQIRDYEQTSLLNPVLNPLLSSLLSF